MMQVIGQPLVLFASITLTATQTPQVTPLNPLPGNDGFRLTQVEIHDFVGTQIIVASVGNNPNNPNNYLPYWNIPFTSYTGTGIASLTQNMNSTEVSYFPHNQTQYIEYSTTSQTPEKVTLDFIGYDVGQP